MKWLILIFVVLACIVLIRRAAAATRPATGPTTSSGLRRHDVCEMQLELQAPARWRPSVERWKDAERDNEEFTTLRFDGVDRASTSLSLTRLEKALTAVQAADIVKQTAALRRDSTIKNGGQFIEEREITVAGVPARSVELSLPSPPFKMRMFFVNFVLHDCAYELALVGQDDHAKDVKPDVLRLLESVRSVSEASAEPPTSAGP